MKTSLTILLVIAAVSFAKAQNPDFPVTPPAERPAGRATTSKQLGFCVLDYGSPHAYGSPTSFWISASGKVFTQEFKTNTDGWFEERYEYSISNEEKATLLRLLDVLREDTRTLKERYAQAGEFAPHIAFTISPLSDLFIRERHASDAWKQFSALSSHLSDLHRRKIKLLKPTFASTRERGELWEPEGFISRTTIYGLRYICSDRYNAILEAHDKSETDVSPTR